MAAAASVRQLQAYEQQQQQNLTAHFEIARTCPIAGLLLMLGEYLLPSPPPLFYQAVFIYIIIL